ncbi:dephospho-CoA kinase [Sphingomonas psychrotolerans]|uniref:Dephospho-CoA kinase n=1 Tax=Sphingomonas psychrotolerans TaxID=1327635 RepID=A0ABU3N8Y9_9SPHN|nr:dephospho-CoA kinase [Sphingomonas psychrotolerans]MDT8760736.1 dephospho-CoA kinase [Sphingomonas psychrotolerans]
MITIGLTGSIGMGKSTVAQMFADEGVPVFDADEMVHHLQGPGGALVEAIEAAFPDTTGAQGVDRTALREAVFGNEAAFARLEALVHPAVARERDAFLKAHADAPVVVLDVPLLFEAGGWAKVDKIAVVSAPPEVQRARVLARPGMTIERFEAILARQMTDAEKRERADFVISTDCPLDETRAQVRAVLTCLSAPAGG